MDVEEFGSASVEADTLALVEVALAVVVGHALLGADSCKTRTQQLAHYYVCSTNIYIQVVAEKTSYRLCISDRSFISDSMAAIFSAEVGWGRPNPRNDMVTSDFGFVVW